MDSHPITLARMYAGLTQAELGRRIGRSQVQIALMEKGERDFQSLAFELWKATGLPESFFSEGRLWAPIDSAVSYRKRGNCPALIKNRALFTAAIAHNCLEPLVGQYVTYPLVDIPHIPASEIPRTESGMSVARRLGAEAARRVREEWGIGWGPISDVIRLVESKGIRFFFVRQPAESLDGFACWGGEKPYIFVNSFIADPARTRFDVAHELGHIVMHRDLELSRDVDLLEAMAHGFAAEFLAPWETFKREAGSKTDLDSLAALRRRWRISMQAIIRHMYANGAITHGSYTSAFKRFSYLGYRRGPEPGWMLPDASIIHSTFWDVVSAKREGIQELCSRAGMPEAIIQEMIPSPGDVYAVV